MTNRFLNHSLTAAILIVLLVAGPSAWAGRLSQLAEFVAPDGQSGDGFGGSVAIDGDTLVVGAPGDSHGTGAVYVYVKNYYGWQVTKLAATLTASDPGRNFFGGAVAIVGDTIAVGAPGASVNGFFPGAVYVFVRPAGGWTNMTQTAKLTPSDPTAIGCLGSNVAIAGNVIAAGGETGQNGDAGIGGAYVFVAPTGGWKDTTETAVLTPSDGTVSDYFGWSISATGKEIVVGAPQAPYTNGPGPGKAYLFVEPPQGWTDETETAQLAASDGQSDDFFGGSVSMVGATVAVRARNAHQTEGAIYVFVKSKSEAGTVTETAELDPTNKGYLGSSVQVIQNGTAIVAGGQRGKGAVYGFLRPAGGWAMSTSFNFSVMAKDSEAGDGFGSAIAVSGNIFVVGSPRAPINGLGDGAAYVFGPSN